MTVYKQKLSFFDSDGLCLLIFVEKTLRLVFVPRSSLKEAALEFEQRALLAVLYFKRSVSIFVFFSLRWLWAVFIFQMYDNIYNFKGQRKNGSFFESWSNYYLLFLTAGQFVLIFWCFVSIYKHFERNRQGLEIGKERWVLTCF